MFDDMNDWVEGFDGHPQTSTPAIADIASNGTIFLNAFCSAPVCAPSRTSLLTGKNPTYTGIYNNEEYIDTDFRANFPPEKYIITLPEYLKDNAGYYTYCMDKIFHADQHFPDYDIETIDNCSKSLSWNQMISVGNAGGVNNAGEELGQSIENFEWAKLDESYTTSMQDYAVTGDAINFLSSYQDNPEQYCNKPFFLALGYHKPHLQLYIPEQYFLPDYIIDFYEEPFNIPYNYPQNAFPYNGVVLPPQPSIEYQDYDSLGFMGQALAAKGLHDNFKDWVDSFDVLPVINDSLSYNESNDILIASKRANATMAYLAAVKFIDEQLGRFWTALEENPEILNNTILILASDHGYSLDEKKHWKKNGLWETDLHIPYIIVDFRNINQQVSYIPVSLLDLFPTICDYAMVPPPRFPDSTIYLEGKNLRPLIENNSLKYESPVISTYKSDFDKQAGCMEQFSVHNGRFHLIQYHSNNIEGNLECDSLNSILEEELYEIGVNRDLDINEWNNLSKNADYTPVKEFLVQWLPGNALFTQKTFKPIIGIEDVPCLVNEIDTLALSIILYDTSGILISAPSGYKYIWTNNLTTDTLFGPATSFPLQSLGSDIYNSNDFIILYLQMVDTISNVIVGFDLKSVYLNDDESLNVDFNVTSDSISTTVTISNIFISGSYNKMWWDYDNGYIYYGSDPGPYVYPEYGTFSITCYVNYGNGDECIDSFTNSIQTISFGDDADNFLFVFPNPASGFINIATKELVEEGEIIIFEPSGKPVNNYTLQNNYLLINKIDISQIKTGIYFITLKTPSSIYTTKLIVV